MLKKSLIIFDLGYWDYSLFSRLTAAGIFFLSCVKERAKIEITGVVTSTKWREALGRNLFDINKKNFRGDSVEFLGSVFHGDDVNTEMRVLGFWNERSKSYHWYVTNLSLAAEMIYPLYRIRWHVELSFKAVKQSFSLDDAPSGNYQIILHLMLVGIMANLLAQPIARVALTNATPIVQAAVSFQRVCKVFVQIAPDLMVYLLTKTTTNLRHLCEKIRRFLTELVDPNYNNRGTSMRRLGVI